MTCPGGFVTFHSVLAALSTLILTAPSLLAVQTTPEEHLGRPVGRDFELADWEEVSSYFEKLGAESPNVTTAKVGTTTEGRDFLLATISSPENLANLDEIKSIAAKLADPRGLSAEDEALCLKNGKVVLFISCAMHATECASPQFAMEFAHQLATSTEEPWASTREKCVVLLAPSLNPDGLDHVVSWYRETVGTPYESAGLLKLYQYYAGHDNNRDWFMLSLEETRIVTRLLYSEWHPQVYWDVHQQGSRRERLFVPPFRDPLNPNLEPTIITGIDELGTRALFDLTRWGYTGISTGVSYDMWWNGGNRNVPVRHNIVGLLTEAASCRLATPMFLPRSELHDPKRGPEYVPSNSFPNPWPGGWWRIRDIIDYEAAFGRSLLGSLSRERGLWLDNALRASRNSMKRAQEEGPVAWLIPSDNADIGAVRRLVDTLLVGGVEIWRADAAFKADGRDYPAGTLVLSSSQPYAQHVKDLFEVQRYPKGDAPYDVAGWTLPMLLGVRRVEVVSTFEVDLKQVVDTTAALAGFDAHAGAAYGSSQNSDDWKAVVASGGGQLAVGDNADPRVPKAGALSVGGGTAFGADVAVRPLSTERIGLYAPWSGSMDEGWTRWVLDEFGIPFTGVRNEMLRAGKLRELLDVLVLPSISGRQLDAGRAPGSVPSEYSRGLDPEGAIAIEEFVREGGRLVCVGSSSAWAIDLFRLPLVDVTRTEEGRNFACPGSVLRGIPVEHQLTSGLESSVALFFSRSAAWRAMTDSERKSAEESGPLGEGPVEPLLLYAPSRVLLSGFIEQPEVIAGRQAWVRAEHGEGEIHLFGFRPQYRAWAQDTFQLLFRSMLVR